MNDVKLNNLSLVKDTRPTASSPSPEPRQSAATEQLPEQQREDLGEAGRAAGAAARQVEGDGAKQRELREVVAKLNDYVQSVQRDLAFEFDESSGKAVITVIDRKTQEVVRQIPDELALKLARNLQQDEPLSLFNMKV